MDARSVRPTDSKIEETVKTYADSLFRLCFSILRNTADAEDAVSDAFLRYITKAPVFDGEEHEKAWLMRVAINICKDLCRRRKLHLQVSAFDSDAAQTDWEDGGILRAVAALPIKYKAVIHLFYIEGYKTGEIASMLSVSPAAVRKRLEYGRRILKERYMEEL